MSRYKFRNTLLLSVLALMMFNSCKKEDEVKPALMSFGPTTAKHGETIKFIGVGLDQVTDIMMPVGIDVPSSVFTTHTASLIEITVPEESMMGYVTLKTTKGEITSKTVFGAAYEIVVTSMTPTAAKPGTNVTINGNFLNYVKKVTFADSQIVTDFVSQSLHQLVVQVPMAAQTGPIVLTDMAKLPQVVDRDASLNTLLLNVTLPAVTAINPSSARHTETIALVGTNLDLVTSVVFTGGAEVNSTNFVSQSETKIELAVPSTALKGKLTLKQISPVTVATPDLTIILPVGTSLAPSPAKPGIDNVTITGTDLDLVASLTLSGVGQPVSTFVSQSSTQIVLLLPAGATNGGVKYTTTHGFSGNLGVNVFIPTPGPAPLPVVLYDETIAPGGGDWSWNAVTSDKASAEQFYSGNVSWKFETTTSGGLSAGGITAVDASGQQVFAFSLYGGPGTNGAVVAAILNDTWSDYNTVTLVEGKWTDYQIPLSKYPNVDITKIVRFAFKVDSQPSSLIYADRVGFGAAGPAPLDYYIYDDQVENGWQEWGGWNLDAKDFANTEQVFKGSKSIKAVYNGQWGAIQIGRGSAFDLTAYTTLTLRVYASAEQDFIFTLNDSDPDNYLHIPQGWSEVSLPIATMKGNTSAVTVIDLKNNNPNLPTTLYFDEIGLKH